MSILKSIYSTNNSKKSVEVMLSCRVPSFMRQQSRGDRHCRAVQSRVNIEILRHSHELTYQLGNTALSSLALGSAVGGEVGVGGDGVGDFENHTSVSLVLSQVERGRKHTSSA